MEDDVISVEDQLTLEDVKYGRELSILLQQEDPPDGERQGGERWAESPDRTLNVINVYDSDSEPFDDNFDDELPFVRVDNRSDQGFTCHNVTPRSPGANTGDLRTMSIENTAYNREESIDFPNESVANTSNRTITGYSSWETFSRRDGGQHSMTSRYRSCTVKRRGQTYRNQNLTRNTRRSAEEVSQESSLDASVGGNENHVRAPRSRRRSGASIQRAAKRIPTSRRTVSNEYSSSSWLALSRNRSSSTQPLRVYSRKMSARSRNYGPPTSTITSPRQLEPPLPSPRHDNANRTVAQVSNYEDNSSTFVSQTIALRRAQEANSTVPGSSTRKRPATEPLALTSKFNKFGAWEDVLPSVETNLTDSSPDNPNTSTSVSSANRDSAIDEQSSFICEFVDTNTATIDVDMNALLPTFDPLAVNANILSWLRKIEYYVDTFKWNDKDTLLYVLPKLKGTARSWYRYQANDTIEKTWNEWKAKLIEAFTRHDDYAEMLKTMLAYKAKIGDHLEMYCSQKIDLLEQCGIKGRKAVDCILDGVEDRDMVMGIRAALFTEVNDVLMYFKTIASDNDGSSK